MLKKLSEFPKFFKVRSQDQFTNVGFGENKTMKVHKNMFVTFIYYKNATKFCEISTVDLSYVSKW